MDGSRKEVAADRVQHDVAGLAVEVLEPVAQADLGRAVALDPKDLVGILNDLQEASLLVRAPDPKDRRKNAVSLTAAGRRRLEDCTAAGDRANAELLAPLTPDERSQFLDMLRRITGAARD
ncbi:MarR family winged helix-turn-helix transcriptional regulator [Streptomyces sp. NPDC048213]|uniref:MarR family winged helix-turn-helix transcriptional regulator n=1 Tax=Streptomyces sp. NPDC048213 TaxID=3160984 RepID=UPI0033D8DA4C